MPRSQIRRELPSCAACSATLRWRAIVAALSWELFGDIRTIDEFEGAGHLVGLGTSDWEGYGLRLALVCAYRNTFYDREPRLDLAAPVPAPFVSSCDFVLSSDVLEHVPPPVDVSIGNLRRLLKPGGVLVCSVPTVVSGPIVEHFPRLADYEVVEREGSPVLLNRLPDGTTEVFEDLVFHGGVGATLEMRLFSGPALIESLERAGFVDVRPFDHQAPERGILWDEPWTWPVTARAPG